MKNMLNVLVTTYLTQDAHITTELLRLSRELEQNGFVQSVEVESTCKFTTGIMIILTMIWIIWLYFVLDATQKSMKEESSQKEGK